jgi:hypothetical protein
MTLTDGTKTYRIFFDREINAVVMQWNGYATSDEFKEGTELMLHCLLENKACKVLADIKGMKIIGMEDQKWLDTNFLPRAIQAGFKAIAIIEPDYYFNKVAVESISYKVSKDKLTINFFDDIGKAKRWLSEVL